MFTVRCNQGCPFIFEDVQQGCLDANPSLAEGTDPQRQLGRAAEARLLP